MKNIKTMNIGTRTFLVSNLTLIHVLYIEVCINYIKVPKGFTFGISMYIFGILYRKTVSMKKQERFI